MIPISINLDPITKKFQSRVWADILSLRVITDSIKDGTYANKYNNKTYNGMTFEISPPVLNQGLVDYEVIKTFSSIMRNVNDYIDELISIMLLTKHEIKTPTPMDSQKLSEFMNQQIQLELQKYCQKTKEEFSQKLLYFQKLPSKFIQYITRYNTLRNCYEHHKAISGKGINIPIFKIKLMSGDKPIKLGEVLKTASVIKLKISQKTIVVKKGNAAIISQEDIESTAFYIVTTIPSLLIPKVIEKIKNSSIKKTL